MAPIRTEKKAGGRQLTLTGEPGRSPSSPATSTTKQLLLDRSSSVDSSTKPNPKPKPKQKRGTSTKFCVVETDVLLSIKPEFVELIAQRRKNYEYRKYKLRDSVKRLWLYEVKPVSAITHVIEVGPARRPGEVRDPSGIGNDDFNAGRKLSKYGYPVLGMYRLDRPLDLRVLKEWLGVAPPQAFMYVPRELCEGVKVEKMVKVF